MEIENAVNVAVVGAGYVGLVTGACLAETGNNVVCADCDRDKVELLRRGQSPIYEPGLADLLARNISEGRLHFTLDAAEAVRRAELVFLAVGTPPQPDGSVDLAALWSAVDQMAPALGPETVVVLKSTVPVGTNAAVSERLAQRCGAPRVVVNNPEFLKEGTAIDDFMKPDRVVVGSRDARAADLLRELYRPYLRTDKPLLVMSPESAEMTKYAANALLAAKISFINEIAGLCEHCGADVDDVRRGIGHDSRIGFQFLFPGAGYGGSCFPKDVAALVRWAQSQGLPASMIEAVEQVNRRQKNLLADKIERHFGPRLAGAVIAVWGLSFKPGTDDIREAPSLVLIDRLLDRGARVQVFDPKAIENVRRIYGDRLRYGRHRDDVLAGADALAIVTEWKAFLHPDQAALRQLRERVIFDGRNLFDPRRIAEAGFTYYSVGRPMIAPAGSA